MPKISTIANSSPVLLTDKMVGTNVAGTPANVTKNFLVSDLLTLFQSNITLQNVINAGNTATLPTFADNAAAVAGGLSVTTVYKTAAGELRIVV